MEERTAASQGAGCGSGRGSAYWSWPGAVAGLLVVRNARGNGVKKKDDKVGPHRLAGRAFGRGPRAASRPGSRPPPPSRPRTPPPWWRAGRARWSKVLAEEGQWVEKGAVLARLDDTER